MSQAELFPRPRRPNPRADALEVAIETAGDPVDVVEATLRLRDELANPVPVGGGLATSPLTRSRAADVVAALERRGLLAPVQGDPNGPL